MNPSVTPLTMLRDERAHETVRGALRTEVALALEHEDVLLVLVLGLLDLDAAVCWRLTLSVPLGPLTGRCPW